MKNNLNKEKLYTKDLIVRGIFGQYYRKKILNIYRGIVPEHSSILQIGCGDGELLSTLKPSIGVGIDLSKDLINIANKRDEQLSFKNVDIRDLNIEDLPTQSFDYIILSDYMSREKDIQGALNSLHKFCNQKTRIIINNHSNLWYYPLLIAKFLKFTSFPKELNWITPHDLNNFLLLSSFDQIKTCSEIVVPFYIPIISNFLNKYLSKILLQPLCITNFTIARPNTYQILPKIKPTISIVVPARNEAGHIESLVRRIPKFDSEVEIIFVEGGSSDNTYEEITRVMTLFPNKNFKLIKQSGKGKGNAVREGFEIGTGEIFMILDADISVPPETLSLFYDAIVDNKGDFINGVRLVYPLEKNSMKFANMVANKFFGFAFTWLLEQPIRDTLCGTKVLRSSDYRRILSGRKFFGDFDPFGDFDLLFGAAKLNMKIIGLPIRYQARSYGDTNIHRWKHGIILFKMMLFAAKKIKFYC